jgi:hypothetical protein
MIESKKLVTQGRPKAKINSRDEEAAIIVKKEIDRGLFT